MANHLPPLNILIVTTGHVLDPRAGNELRVHWLARELGALGHHVDVVSLLARNHAVRAATLGEWVDVRERHSVWLDAALAADRLRLVPVTELPVWLRPLRPALRRRLSRRIYDVVQFEFPWFAGLYPAVREPSRIVYSAHNIESEWWSRGLGRFAFPDCWRRRLERHERRAIERAKGVVACTDPDRDWMLARTRVEPERVAVIPNGYDAGRIHPPAPADRADLRRRLGFAPDEKIALFIGSDTPPNREAAELIATRIAPALRGRGVRCVIAGRVGAALAGPADTPTAGPTDSLTIVGPVDDPLPWMQAADVGLNPMLAGGGSNLKLAEYLAAGLPVVTTEFGLRGYEPLRPWVAVRAVDDFPAAIAAARWPGEVPADQIAQFAWSAAARRLAAFYASLIQMDF